MCCLCNHEGEHAERSLPLDYFLFSSDAEAPPPPAENNHIKGTPEDPMWSFLLFRKHGKKGTGLVEGGRVGRGVHLQLAVSRLDLTAQVVSYLPRPAPHAARALSPSYGAAEVRGKRNGISRPPHSIPSLTKGRDLFSTLFYFVFCERF